MQSNMQNIDFDTNQRSECIVLIQWYFDKRCLACLHQLNLFSSFRPNTESHMKIVFETFAQ